MSNRGYRQRGISGRAGVQGCAEKLPAAELPRWKRSTTASLLIVVCLSLLLNLLGIDWGQPGGYPWHPDSIAGIKIVYQMENLFGPWQQKYPRVHFLVSAIAYKPLLSYWKENPATVPDRSTGVAAKEVLNTERVSILVVVSGVISALMGTGAVVAVFLTARVLFSDDAAAFFAGLALAFSMDFVLFSHLGNVDVPCTFWFAWSLYWMVKAAYIGKWRHFLLLGLFCSLAVCTKEPAVGFVVGLAAAFWLAAAGDARRVGQSWPRALMAVFRLKVFMAAFVAAFLFALLEDLLTTPQTFSQRMKFWFEVGVAPYSHSFTGQWSLFVSSCRVLYGSLGWPLLAMVVVSAVYCILKYRGKAVLCLLPLLAFYIVVTARTALTIERYFIPGFAGLMLLVGKAASDLLRYPKLPRVVKAAPLVAVYGLSLLYCVGLDLEILDDSRYRAVKWLAQHVRLNDAVVALSQPAYAPAVNMLGCKFAFVSERPKDDKLLMKLRQVADYLVLSEIECSFPEAFDKEFLKQLVGGAKGYKEVARFSNKYLLPRKTIFGIAGWPFERSSQISPWIIILKKQ